MLKTWIQSTGIRRSPRMPITTDLGEQHERGYCPRGPREDRVISECFGRLTAREEAVIKGLAVSLAGATARRPSCR
jgi:hypothetical protein